jgi:hypothetical protein
MLFRWKEVRTWRTKAHTHTHTSVRTLLYLSLSSVSAAHSHRVHIHTSIYTLCECLGLNDAYRVFVREAHTTGTLSRIICASCPASLAQYLIWQQHVACMRAIPEYISTSFWPALSASFTILYLYMSLHLPFHILYSSITFCRRHFILQSVPRCTDPSLLIIFLTSFFGWPRFFSLSVSVSRSFSRSYTYLLSSLCWVGNQSLGTQAHYPCTVSTIRVMILGLCCCYTNIYDFWVRHYIVSMYPQLVQLFYYIILECVLVACLDACRAIIFLFEANLVWFTFQQISLYFW